MVVVINQRMAREEPALHVALNATPESWLNLDERLNGTATAQAARGGTFDSVAVPITATRAYIERWNDHCRPFTWTKTADESLIRATRQGDSDAGR